MRRWPRTLEEARNEPLGENFDNIGDKPTRGYLARLGVKGAEDLTAADPVELWKVSEAAYFEVKEIAASVGILWPNADVVRDYVYGSANFYKRLERDRNSFPNLAKALGTTKPPLGKLVAYSLQQRRALASQLTEREYQFLLRAVQRHEEVVAEVEQRLSEEAS